MSLPEAPGPAIAAAAQAHCRNCGAPLAGQYCSRCGQVADVHVPSTKELIHEVLEGLTHSDSRLWKSLLYLWLKPGKLTTEFIAGRRVAYLPPFRLYLIVSVAFFFLASFNHPNYVVMDGSGETSGKADTKDLNCQDLDIGRPAWNARLLHACNVVRADNGASLNHLVVGTVPKAMFIFLPLVAALHMLLYWWPRHRYAEHLLFFLHIHAFYFSLAIVSVASAAAAVAWPAFKPVASAIGTLIFWTLLTYTLFAMRRVFGRSWKNTLAKAVALFFIYMIVMALTIGLVFIYAALQL